MAANDARRERRNEITFRLIRPRFGKQPLDIFRKCSSEPMEKPDATPIDSDQREANFVDRYCQRELAKEADRLLEMRKSVGPLLVSLERRT